MTLTALEIIVVWAYGVIQNKNWMLIMEKS